MPNSGTLPGTSRFRATVEPHCDPPPQELEGDECPGESAENDLQNQTARTRIDVSSDLGHPFRKGSRQKSDRGPIHRFDDTAVRDPPGGEARPELRRVSGSRVVPVDRIRRRRAV